MLFYFWGIFVPRAQFRGQANKPLQEYTPEWDFSVNTWDRKDVSHNQILIPLAEFVCIRRTGASNYTACKQANAGTTTQ